MILLGAGESPGGTCSIQYMKVEGRGGGVTELHTANSQKVHEPDILHPNKCIASQFPTQKNTRLKHINTDWFLVFLLFQHFFPNLHVAEKKDWINNFLIHWSQEIKFHLEKCKVTQITYTDFFKTWKIMWEISSWSRGFLWWFDHLEKSSYLLRSSVQNHLPACKNQLLS